MRSGIVFGANGNYEFPGADMAKRFGADFRVGPSVMYKTKRNFMFGTKFDFILGGKIKEDSLMANVKANDGSFLDNNGQRVNVGIFERGYVVGLQAGKIFNFNPNNPNSGILVLTGAGFIQHRILIYDKDKTIVQLRDPYRKGYDRLTNGWYAEQFVGYQNFDKNGLLNFNIGLNVLAGFTQGRRDYLFDVMRKDDKSRVDLLFGIRAGIDVPIFRKKSEETFFE